MFDVEETIFLRDPSLEDQVRALVAGVATHPDKIVVEPMDDPEDPEYRLTIVLYPASMAQQTEWIAEIRSRLRDELGIVDAPTGRDLELLELAPAKRA